MSERCAFCDKLASDESEGVSWQSEVATFVPLNPVTEGHRLFVPVQHVEDASQVPHVTGMTFSAASRWASNNLPEGQAFNLITSVGADATQTVFHLHVHLIPRAEGDGLHLPWTGPSEREDKS